MQLDGFYTHSEHIVTNNEIKKRMLQTLIVDIINRSSYTHIHVFWRVDLFRPRYDSYYALLSNSFYVIATAKICNTYCLAIKLSYYSLAAKSQILA